MSNFCISEGRRVPYTPSSAVTAGTPVNLGGSLGVGIPVNDVEADVEGAFDIAGLYSAPKEAGGGVVFSIGEEVEWDESAGLAVENTNGDYTIGYAVKAAADGDSVVWYLLNNRSA